MPKKYYKICLRIFSNQKKKIRKKKYERAQPVTPRVLSLVAKISDQKFKSLNTLEVVMIARFFRISEIILVQCCICQFYWGVWLQHMSKRFEQWLFSMLLLYRIRDGVFGISIPKSRSRHRKIMKLLLKLVTKTCVFHSFQNCFNT